MPDILACHGPDSVNGQACQGAEEVAGGDNERRKACSGNSEIVELSQCNHAANNTRGEELHVCRCPHMMFASVEVQDMTGHSDEGCCHAQDNHSEISL